MRDIYPIADVYMTAHTHKPAYMSGVFYEEARPVLSDQHFVVCGTFKNNGDLYSLRNFGNAGVLGLPTLAFWADRHEVAYFRSPQTALEVLNQGGRYDRGPVCDSGETLGTESGGDSARPEAARERDREWEAFNGIDAEAEHPGEGE